MLSVNEALEQVHRALNEQNIGLDSAIAVLKASLYAKGENAVVMDPARLPQNNRQGRKMLQTYFKKRGVLVVFATGDPA
jgi:hypothetical protein